MKISNSYFVGGGHASPRTLLVPLVLAIGAFSVQPAPTYAQEAGAIEEIIVTGSRIARNPNLTNVSPVTAVNSEEFLYAGVTRTEDLLNDLPSIYADQDAGQANGATGTATVNLRGLGSDRTLVMLNGRRLPPGTPGQGGFAPDLNQIPAALVERVDVLTGGSSATYGSDAVAGVVNFITVSDFEGFKIDLQSSGYRHRNDNSTVQALLEERRAGLEAAEDPSAEGYESPSSSVSDGRIDTIALTFGVNAEDGRGNLTGYFTYRDVEAVLQADRDYSRCDFGGAITDEGCIGSGTIPNGRFTNFGALSGGASAFPKPMAGCPANTREMALPVQMGKNGVTADRTDVCVPNGGDILDEEHEDYIEGALPFVYDFIPGTGGADGTFVERPETLLYNYAPTNYFQRPDENTTAGLFFHYDITDNVELYSEINYADNHTQAQIAYSGAFFVTDDLSCGNPLMSDAQFNTVCGQLGLTRDQSISNLEVSTVTQVATGAGPDGEFGTDDDVMTDALVSKVDENDEFNGMLAVNPATLTIGKRNVEGGPRSDDLRHTSFRGVFGFRGELPNGWDWDIYPLTSEVSLQETYMNDLSTTRITRALDVVADDDGNPVCRTALSGEDPNCVPWNLFHGQGLKGDLNAGVTQEALDYLRIPLFRRGTTEQDVTAGYISGDLGQYGVQLPAADEGVSMALGFELREVSLQTNPDDGFVSGDGAGQGGPTLPIDGEYDVEEYFTELLIPLAQGRDMADDLSLELAYRYSDYSTGNQTDTWKTGISWTPVPDVTFRATAQRAVRAPHIYELFLPQGNNLANIVDPCSADERAGDDPPSFEECARTGVTQVQYNANLIPTSHSGQYNFRQGGNTELEPEVSDTFSFGVILQPSALPGLDITVDYFDIDVQEAIASISPQTILDKCLDGSAPALCGFINRGANNGNLWLGDSLDNPNYGYIEALDTNIGFFATEGFDIEANYNFDLPNNLGSMRLSTKAVYLTEWEQEEFEGAGVQDCLGYWSGSCEEPTYELQNNFRATWFTPWDFDATLSWRYISGVDSLDADHVNLPVRQYFDLAGIWRLPYAENTEVRFGINNLLDTEPPLFGDGSEQLANGNTFPGYYDALGQYYFIGLSVGFE